MFEIYILRKNDKMGCAQLVGTLTEYSPSVIEIAKEWSMKERVAMVMVVLGQKPLGTVFLYKDGKAFSGEELSKMPAAFEKKEC